MQLRQPEALRVLDQHDRRVGHVNADFDHGRRDQDIDARFVHQPVEQRGIERGGVLALGDVEHGRSPGPCEFIGA